MASRFSRPPIAVGNPLALFARVIEIEHGGDGVHAQAIGMILVEPEHGARHQKAADFGAAVIEDERLPVGMKSLARVGVLEEMGAVEKCKAVAIGREVRGNPVENDADVVLVEIIDEIHEILRRAVTRGGREVAGGLISPGAVERMLHDGEQFDVGEAQLVDVIGKAGRDFAVGQRSDCVLRGRASRSRDELRRWRWARAWNWLRRAFRGNRRHSMCN